ncbi:FAD-binding protein [Desulfovibrio sp. OttesenSCG-928-C14]|nr:FAD-binding protein [Desulfovibrio sp. OttesenSCG-928-C14]
MIALKKTIETDVLVIGGGIAGLMAAIGAARGGARVILADKANTKRSGSGATGNDHFMCYIPQIHGDDIRIIMREVADSLVGAFHDTQLTKRFLDESFEVVQMWEEFGINMRPWGEYKFMGHAFPDRPRVWLKYDGHNQKPALTAAAKKAGVEIINHLPAVDIVVENGRVTGALLLDVSDEEPAFVAATAKKVILATGTANRLYTPAGTPSKLFNTAFCPSCAGAAQAQAWRAGAKLVNLEMPNRHAGPKYLARCGKSTWIGLYRYPDGQLLGPFVTKATKELGDITSDVWNSAFTDVMKNGRGPSYLDCTVTAPEDLKFMREAMASEGLTALLDYMDKEGIDPGKHAVEFMQYEPHLIGRGLDVDVNGETSISGLYGAGDMVGNFRADIGGAAVYGWIAGKHASESAPAAQVGPDASKSAWLQERVAYYSKFMGRETTHDWKEANAALQQLVTEYAAAGPYNVRSATLLKAGLTYLAHFRKHYEERVGASCSHTLMRTIEVGDLIECAEALMHAALERKESRGMHLRSDFTFTNPLLTDKFLTVRREQGKVLCEWRQRKSF